MANSATGGYLVGIESSIEGQTLDRFLNTFIVGITGISGNLVRPMWQLNPPKMPSNTVDWVAYGIIIVDQDANAYIEQTDLVSILRRNEVGELSIVCYGASAFTNVKRIRDALQIAQNREYLRAYGITIKGTKPLNHIPELVGDIWYNRVDMTIEFVREIVTSYNVLPITSVQGTYLTESHTFSSTDPMTGTELIYQS